MQTIELPALYYPFPAAACHPEAEALVAHVLDWTWAQRLVSGDPRAAENVRSYSMLAARCYPAAPREHLFAIGDYYSWLFFFDDACEGLSLGGASPADVRGFLTRIYAALRDPAARGEGPAAPFVDALADIWRRVARASAPSWRARFIRHVENYIDACVWEATNRSLDQIPSRAVFQTMRSYTSTMYEFWDFIELAGGFVLPDEVVEHPLIAELARTANAAASFANDIFSLRKEAVGRDFHNLVLVLERERGLPLREAYHDAAALHDAQVRHFCALERLLPSFGAVDRDLARYIKGMRVWMRANYEWSSVTPRYNAGA
jgi:hypothetical protein